jgi:hypothetical protein
MRKLDDRILARRSEVLGEGLEQGVFVLTFEEAITFCEHDMLSQNILFDSVNHDWLIEKLEKRQGYDFNGSDFRRWGFDLKV